MVVLPSSFRICGDENRFPSAQKTICGSGRLSMIPPHPKQCFEIGRNSAFLLTLLVLLLSAFLGQGTVPALADTTQCLYGSRAYGTYMENAINVPIDFCIYQENNDIIFKISCSPGQCSNWHWPDGNGSITAGTRPWFFINGTYTYEIRDSVTHIIVGGVNHIGNDAFNGFSNLKSVEIADDVESIGAGVFYNCTNLEILIIPPGVKNIGSDALTGVKGPVYAPAASLPEDPGEVQSSLVEYSALTLNPHKAGIITNVDKVKQQSEKELPGGITKNNTSDTYYLRAKNLVGLTVDPGSDFVKVSAVSDNTPLSLTRSGTEFSLTMPAESVTFSTAAVSLSVDPLTYNGEERTAVTVKDGNTTLTAGTDYEVTFRQNGTGITPKNAGEYTAVITGKGSYIGTASVSFTVNKADITPTVTMSDYTYGGTVPAPGIAEGGNPGSGAVTYYYSTVNSTENGIKWENITGTTLEAGTYYMYAVVAETDNYKEGITAAVSFTVSKADITPTVTMSDYTYGGTVPAPGIAEGGNPGSGAVTYYYSTADSTENGIKWENITGTTLETGTYYMYAVVAETDNYKEGATTAATSFIVTAADGAVVTITGRYDTAVYDGQEHSVSGYDVDISNPLYDESYFTFAGTAEAKRLGIGTTVMGLKAEQFTNTNKDFTNVLFTVTDGYQTVTPKAVTVTAVDKSKTAGETDPALTVRLEGIIGTDTLNYSLSREAGEDPGTYEITISGEAEQGNYSVIFVNGTFTIIAEKSYIVKFDPNGGSGTMTDQVFTVDEAQALTANSFTRDGYSFLKWNTAKDGSGTAYEDKQNVKNLAPAGKTIMLYAQWEENEKPEEKEYIVKFDPNGGSGAMTDQVFTVDEAQALTANSFTRDGYSFLKWNTAKDGSGTAYEDKQNVKNLAPAGKTIMLYAQWEENEKPEEKVELPVRFEHYRQDGGLGTPADIPRDTKLNLSLKLTGNGPEVVEKKTVMTVQPGDRFTNAVFFFEKEPNYSEYLFEISVEPLSVRADIFSGDQASIKTYSLSVESIAPEDDKEKNFQLKVMLLWDDGTGGWKLEILPVYALPEDEIGAYVVYKDGTKEYLLFQTYDICMRYLGSVEMCSGPGKCFHK